MSPESPGKLKQEITALFGEGIITSDRLVDSSKLPTLIKHAVHSSPQYLKIKDKIRGQFVSTTQYQPPEIPSSEKFEPIKPIPANTEKHSDVRKSTPLTVLFKDEKRTYKIPCFLVSSVESNTPEMSMELELNTSKLYKRILGTSLIMHPLTGLKVPLPVLAKFITALELISETHLETTSPLSRPDEVSVHWDLFNIQPDRNEARETYSQTLIRRKSINVAQTPETFAKALSLASNNKINLQVQKI